MLDSARGHGNIYPEYLSLEKPKGGISAGISVKIQLFWERLSNKSVRDNAERYYGLWSSWSLIELLAFFSDIERNSANKCIYAFSFLVGKHPWTSINERQTRSTHITNRHCRVRFYAFVGQPLSKQLYTSWRWYGVQTTTATSDLYSARS